MRNPLKNSFRAVIGRGGLVSLTLACVSIMLLGAFQSRAQGSYVDPALGAGDSIIRSDIFVGDRQGRVPAKEGIVNFTRQMSGWLSGDSEVLHGVVVHLGRGCLAGAGVPDGGDPYLSDPAGKIALIERGSCTFFEKINRAYAAGAIAVIAFNHIAGGDNLVPMGSSLGSVPIPGFFVGRSAGLTLAAAPVSVKIQAASYKALKDAVTALQRNGTLTKQQAASLKDKISEASAATYSGDYERALTLMIEFRAQITSLRDDGALPNPEFLGLNGAVDRIVERVQWAVPIVI